MRGDQLIRSCARLQHRRHSLAWWFLVRGFLITLSKKTSEHCFALPSFQCHVLFQRWRWHFGFALAHSRSSYGPSLCSQSSTVNVTIPHQAFRTNKNKLSRFKQHAAWFTVSESTACYNTPPTTPGAESPFVSSASCRLVVPRQRPAPIACADTPSARR